ncbi:MAG: GNAT family N-acetyltransferase [Rickettsiales bacterium]|jgi:GNAT superfamily N-acetyltransferase|nr:GNAT family N-acetyltransferase [Rickettsiales bacterium]
MTNNFFSNVLMAMVLSTGLHAAMTPVYGIPPYTIKCFNDAKASLELEGKVNENITNKKYILGKTLEDFGRLQNGKNGIMIGAFDNDELVGHYAVDFTLEKNMLEHYNKICPGAGIADCTDYIPIFELKSLMVSPSHWRHGIAGRLLLNFRDEIKNVVHKLTGKKKFMLMVEVLKDNEASLKAVKKIFDHDLGFHNSPEDNELCWYGYNLYEE